MSLTDKPPADERERLVVRLPLCPSSNNLYVNSKRRGRTRSIGYLNWIKQADARILTQWRGLKIKKVHGPANVLIRIPLKTRGDADGRIKAALDFLVSRCLTDDDRHYHRVTVERAALPAGECEVVVEAVT